MTDNEIIKFVEHAMYSAKGEDGFKEIHWEHFKDILDLINRQQAEIERLNKEVEYLASMVNETPHTVTIEQLKKALRDETGIDFT